MDNNDRDFNYVEQKIKPKGRKKLKKALSVIGMTILAAVIFGFISRLVFTVSEGAVNRLLGITPTPEPVQQADTRTNRNEVTLPPDGKPLTAVPSTPTPSPVPVSTPETPTEEPTPEPSPTDEPEPSEAPDETDPEAPGDPVSDPIGDYVRMVGRMRALAADAQESLVRVYAVTSGVNWMDESIETRTEHTGVLVADNGIEVLILTEYEASTSADRIEIGFADGTVAEGSIFAADPDTGLAVVAVGFEDIGNGSGSGYSYITLGDSDLVTEGEPVIALGRPNGYYGAVEFGFVSHTGQVSYFVDGIRSEFTTDIVAGSSADGVVVDLEGRLVGLIVPETENEGITVRAVGINSLKTVLVKLLNGSSLPFFGVRAENVPADILEGMGIENGIYVNEVIASSPAADAGIRKGDVIVGIDELSIGSVRDFYEYILLLDEGSSVVLNVYHSGMRDEPAEEITAVLSVK